MACLNVNLSLKQNLFRQNLFQSHNTPELIQLSLQWPSALNRTIRIQKHVNIEKFHTHGIWFPKGKINRIAYEDRHMCLDYEILLQRKELEVMFETYKDIILEYWPNLLKPGNFEAAKEFIEREWWRHGYMEHMTAPCYLYHGLLLRHALPHDFNIPVGILLGCTDLSNYTCSALTKLNMFGNNVQVSNDSQYGIYLQPEINVVYNQNLGCNIIREIRPRFLKHIDFEVALTSGTRIFSGMTKDLTKPMLLPSEHQMVEMKLIEKVGHGQRRKKN